MRSTADCPVVVGGAKFGDVGAGGLNYRYKLWRSWGDPLGPFVAFCMLNPSTAGINEDDATIRRCMDFARRWDAPGMMVVNLFAFRSTNPDALLHAPIDPVGPENEAAIHEAAKCRGGLVLAWGAHPAAWQVANPRDEQVLSQLGDRRVSHLGLTKALHPRHPLRLAASTPRVHCTARELLQSRYGASS